MSHQLKRKRKKRRVLSYFRPEDFERIQRPKLLSQSSQSQEESTADFLTRVSSHVGFNHNNTTKKQINHYNPQLSTFSGYCATGYPARPSENPSTRESVQKQTQPTPKKVEGLDIKKAPFKSRRKGLSSRSSRKGANSLRNLHKTKYTKLDPRCKSQTNQIDDQKHRYLIPLINQNFMNFA